MPFLGRGAAAGRGALPREPRAPAADPLVPDDAPRREPGAHAARGPRPRGRAVRPGDRGWLSRRDAANFTGLILGCIETKFCK